MEFTGASYIPIINYNGEECIILFKSSKANVYCDLGGIEKKMKISHMKLVIERY